MLFKRECEKEVCDKGERMGVGGGKGQKETEKIKYKND